MTTPALAPLVQAFFVDHLLRHKGASPNTVLSYRDAFRLVFRFVRESKGLEPAALRVGDLDAPTVLAFLAHLEQARGNRARSRNARMAAFRTFFRFVALREPDCLDIVARVLAIPDKRSARPAIPYLSRAEVEAVLGATDRATWGGRRDHALLLTLYNTGARASEVCGLRRAEVDLGAGATLRLHGKGRKERTLPLWSKTARTLKAWFAEIDKEMHPFAFPNARAGQLTRHGLAHVLRLAVKRAESTCPSLAPKRVSPHVIRHTTAVHLLQSGVDIAVIALWLGHESIETTHVYLEIDIATKERALSKVGPLGPRPCRFNASDALMAFLDNL